MKTVFEILRADGTCETHETDLPAEPGFEALKALIEPHLEGGRMEHVSVLVQKCHCDMFVDEIGLLKDLPRNEAATEVYRANALAWNPEVDPEALPYIAGPAVLFHRRVWF
ncbi:hypothetical protein [Chelatococcus asaccharovorans]|uniref:Uncharacterized protein n=1 Tax=Chelatococcus asaccharovorans TaxID=28210 RepID=A0A2V3UAT4_9HYPH|nr:hypothetical protein [Chelatococcus asaccharovorans]MBS7703263.1 hypothetical protein [Chelatococcus asaccharovorans]PXW61595.1 hypothetical protein C7450_103112 [Chelatococcus asaccharovorans]